MKTKQSSPDIRDQCFVQVSHSEDVVELKSNAVCLPSCPNLCCSLQFNCSKKKKKKKSLPSLETLVVYNYLHELILANYLELYLAYNECYVSTC